MFCIGAYHCVKGALLTGAHLSVHGNHIMVCWLNLGLYYYFVHNVFINSGKKHKSNDFEKFLTATQFRLEETKHHLRNNA